MIEGIEPRSTSVTKHFFQLTYYDHFLNSDKIKDIRKYECFRMSSILLAIFYQFLDQLNYFTFIVIFFFNAQPSADNGEMAGFPYIPVCVNALKEANRILEKRAGIIFQCLYYLFKYLVAAHSVF